VPFQPLAVAGFPALADGTLTAGAYADRIRQLWAIIGAAFQSGRRPGDVDVAAAHLHVTGAVLSRSEREVHVSDDAATDPSAMPAVSYAAYGHIHKPQLLPGSSGGRYAGSAIPIDFGEAGEIKGAVVVEAAPGRAARVEFVSLPFGRPLVTVTGALSDLAGLLSGHPDSIVRVRVTDNERIDYLASRVAEMLPPGTVCRSVDQPGVRTVVVRAPATEGEVSVLSLLSDYATSQFGDPQLVEGLKALWSTASDDPDADLTAGAVTVLDVVLGGRPGELADEDHAVSAGSETSDGSLGLPVAEVAPSPARARRGRPRKAP
jgi:exonuclease SbcD